MARTVSRWTSRSVATKRMNRYIKLFRFFRITHTGSKRTFAPKISALIPAPTFVLVIRNNIASKKLSAKPPWERLPGTPYDRVSQPDRRHRLCDFRFGDPAAGHSPLKSREVSGSTRFLSTTSVALSSPSPGTASAEDDIP